MGAPPWAQPAIIPYYEGTGRDASAFREAAPSGAKMGRLPIVGIVVDPARHGRAGGHPRREPMRVGISVLLAAVLGGVVFLASPSASLPEAETYGVDAVHSTVIFRINHAGVSNFYGRFNQIDGTFTVTEGGTGSVSVTIPVESIDTANNDRDGHLKGPDFFNAEQFPEITFKSEALKNTGGNKYEAKGTLSMHGVSKEVTVALERIGTKDVGEKMGGVRTGFEGSVTFKRSDFGMKYGIDKGVLGDEIKLILGIEGIRK
jgi:polyisoprenoid-binding protein YceI